MSVGAVNVRLSNSANTYLDVAMTDGSRYLMRSASYADYVIAVTETRNVTPRLGRDEVRALQVLADAGLVAAPARTMARPAARIRPMVAFPHAKAS
jgi:hypothetical protein